MSIDFTRMAWEALARRRLPDGGFADRNEGGYRPDATAWAVIALAGHRSNQALIAPARRRLAASQSADGRICLAPDQIDAFWPTPHAIIAWQGAPQFLAQQTRAIEFLLATTGQQWEKSADSPLGHDTAIKGWPWIAGTHSWVEPSAICLLALKQAGRADHPRVTEAARLLLDRQLSHGGWNYGNTTVFNQELHPMPGSTGMALAALAGLARREQIATSLAYLKDGLDELRTPKSLGWAIKGLVHWDEPVAETGARIDACLARQDVFGPYTTTDLAILLSARHDAEITRKTAEQSHGH